MDCARACPHDNVALEVVPRGRAVVDDRRRSSLGRLSRRADVAAFALLLAFGAFLNAAAMTAPVMRWERSLQDALGSSSRSLAVSLWLLPALLVLPALAALGCTWVGRRASRLAAPAGVVLARFALALVPLGASMWLAHLGFHLVTGAGAALPALSRALAQAGLTDAGTVVTATAPGPVGAGLVHAELLVLDIGLLGTLLLQGRVAADLTSEGRGRLMAPWAALAFLLWAAGVWTFLQPMQMRGLVTG